MKLLLLITSLAPFLAAATTPAAVVNISNFRFEPQIVTINKGETVRWTNNDKFKLWHTASEDAGDFDTGTLKPGESAEIKFEKTGTFHYHCQFHGFTMSGQIVVQ